VKRRTRLWLLVGLVVVLAVVAVAAIAPDSTLFGILVALVSLWFAVSLAALLWSLWRWMTYRVSVRLLLSYLLLGVAPFLICAALGGIALYMAMGQYTSVRFGDEMSRVIGDLQRDCRDVAATFTSSGLGAATEVFKRAQSRPRELVPKVLWRATLGDVTLAGPGASELAELGWVDGDTVATARSGDDLFVVVAVPVEHAGGVVAALIPLDQETARALSRELWFDVLFASLEGEGEEDPSAGVPIGEAGGAAVPTDGGESQGAGPDGAPADAGPGRRIQFDLDDEAFQDVSVPFADADRGLLFKPWVYWFRLTVDVVDLATGGPAKSAISLLRTSPMRVWTDFTESHYELGSRLWGALTGIGLVLLVLYGLALMIAATMIVSVTRSTARLTRGARAVEEGRLDYRIPVKRRDQLGDLALSFNRMAESVESMLADVAEKERLGRELELAREIQESLLPDRHLRHGSLAVHAIFRPAAAVGGDYFDIFPVGDRRLIVVVGDVAGHGLQAGLLMAGLKSMVAVLIREGYSGEELLGRVNALLCERRAGSTIMATLAVIEIDTEADHLRITNAGHPPAYLIADGRAEELMAGSLPLGSLLGQPARIERPFAPGARLLLYSDGLVEATDASGEPYGYERLSATVQQGASLSVDHLELAVVGSLDRFIGDRPLADDLTLLVVERAGAAEGTAVRAVS
jgi:serine phosphatase RsbU (regulator of sigma subunit)